MAQKTGEAGQTYQFTAAQYTALSDEERTAIQRVANYLEGEGEKLEADDEMLSSTFNILGPCDGCVPEEEIGEDILLDIRRKFSCIYYSACELAEEEIGRRYREWRNFSFCFVVDPSYADATHVAVVDFEQEKRPFCYFQEYRKAWLLHFETLQEIAREVLQARDEIVSTFLRVSVKPKTSKKGEM